MSQPNSAAVAPRNISRDGCMPTTTLKTNGLPSSSAPPAIMDVLSAARVLATKFPKCLGAQNFPTDSSVTTNHNNKIQNFQLGHSNANSAAAELSPQEAVTAPTHPGTPLPSSSDFNQSYNQQPSPQTSALTHTCCLPVSIPPEHCNRGAELVGCGNDVNCPRRLRVRRWDSNSVEGDATTRSADVFFHAQQITNEPKTRRPSLSLSSFTSSAAADMDGIEVTIGILPTPSINDNNNNNNNAIIVVESVQNNSTAFRLSSRWLRSAAVAAANRQRDLKAGVPKRVARPSMMTNGHSKTSPCPRWSARRYQQKARPVFRCAPPRRKSPPHANRTLSAVLLRNVQWWVDDCALTEAAGDYGVVRCVTIFSRSDGLQSSGVAVVEFSSETAACQCIADKGYSFSLQQRGSHPVEVFILSGEDLQTTKRAAEGEALSAGRSHCPPVDLLPPHLFAPPSHCHPHPSSSDSFPNASTPTNPRGMDFPRDNRMRSSRSFYSDQQESRFRASPPPPHANPHHHRHRHHQAFPSDQMQWSSRRHSQGTTAFDGHRQTPSSSNATGNSNFGFHPRNSRRSFQEQRMQNKHAPSEASSFSPSAAVPVSHEFRGFNSTTTTPTTTRSRLVPVSQQPQQPQAPPPFRHHHHHPNSSNPRSLKEAPPPRPWGAHGAGGGGEKRVEGDRMRCGGDHWRYVLPHSPPTTNEGLPSVPHY